MENETPVRHTTKREPAKLVIPHRDNKPNYYCVKTTVHLESGKIESEIVKDEKTGCPIAIECEDKPLDGVFETYTETVYYTYHDNYKDAARQVASVGQFEQTTSMVLPTEIVAGLECLAVIHRTTNVDTAGKALALHDFTVTEHRHTFFRGLREFPRDRNDNRGRWGHFSQPFWFGELVSSSSMVQP